MGDLESGFMEEIKDSVELSEVDILFAPHHGIDSGKVPAEWLEQMNPGIVVIGEAPSKHRNILTIALDITPSRKPLRVTQPSIA